MEMNIRGQKELHKEVKEAQFCTGCGACVNLCPYQASYRDEVITLHPCDLKEGGCYAFCPRTPTDLDALKKRLFDQKDLTPEIGAMKGFYITRAADAGVRAGGQHGGTVTTLMALALQEGIIDTGMTAGYLLRNLEARQPRSIRVCTLLDKEVRRIVKIPIAFRGFRIPDRFVVGYGLDFRQLYRNLPYVGVLSDGVTGLDRS